MGQPIARVTDPIEHSPTTTGSILGPGNPTFISGGLPVAKVGDDVICSFHPAVIPNKIIAGSATVKTLGGAAGVARVGDSCTCGATIKSGNPTVLVGP
jgi:uncharacterized Zn-binding protein involved in type VI secretion